MYTGTRPYPDFSRKFFIREVLILNAIAESTILTVSVGSSRLKLAARPVTTTPISSVRNLALANARTAARLSGSVLSTKTKHLLSYKVHLHFKLNYIITFLGQYVNTKLRACHRLRFIVSWHICD